MKPDRWMLTTERQTFQWEAASGPVRAYEVEVEWWPAFGGAPEMERAEVPGHAISLQPRIGQAARVRARALSQVEDMEPGEWSDWSELVATINNPDINGDGSVGTQDFLAIQQLWGMRVSEDGKRLEK